MASTPKKVPKYNQFLVDRIEDRLKSKGLTEMKKMMGGLIFMVNDKMCVGVDKDRDTGEDRLMVRIGPEAHDRLIAIQGSRQMDFTGKVMRGFLFISPEGFDSEEDLDFWIDEALQYNKIAKASPKRKPKKT